MTKKKFLVAVVLAALLSTAGFGQAAAPLVLEAEQFGLYADGKTDDGPVIRKLLEEARAANGPVTIRFPENKKIHVASGTGRYAFRLDQLDHLAIDGNGSTFLVHKNIRFLYASLCTNLGVVNLNVDTTPSPVVEAVVLAQEDHGRILTVRLNEPERAGELGGPTRKDGEQDFFGMLWLPGKYTNYSYHYYVEAVTAEPERRRRSGIVQIHCPDPVPAGFLERIVPGKTRISLPVPGNAHRYGPGPMVRIDRCTNVALMDVEVWSAPWFAFQIFRNDGELTFRRVHIRPKPGSGRMTSSWRDGFHVKGNKGNLLFEDCILQGMNDDAFNVSTHAWRVTEVMTPNHLRMRQVFPIQFMPFQKGGELLILSADGTHRLESARIVAIRGMPGDEIYLPNEKTLKARRTPELELILDQPVEELEVGCILWDKTTANPHTVIRGCRIRNSCRFQSGVTLENCDVSALIYFYCNKIEGPLPENAVVRNCTLRQGRGNEKYAIVFNGWRGGRAPETLPENRGFPLQNILLENNTIYGGLMINGVRAVSLRNNRFHDGSEEIINSVEVERE